MERIEYHRRFYADLIAAEAKIPASNRLVEAFASTPRERYLGPGPWKIGTNSGYIETPNNDPAFLYQNVVVALKETAELNNGLPAMHALCMLAMDIQEGQTIVQVGAGTGYYTAILAKMVGTSGCVHAYEIEPEFCTKLSHNMSDFPQVKLHFSSGTESVLPPCDAIYVNAAATAPLPIWLNALPPMGRLIFPLTPAEGSGAILMIIKIGNDRSPARFLCPAKFALCIGARKEETAQKLMAAFRDRRWTQVRSYRRGESPNESCWFADEDWWLSTEELTAPESAAVATEPVSLIEPV